MKKMAILTVGLLLAGNSVFAHGVTDDELAFSATVGVTFSPTLAVGYTSEVSSQTRNDIVQVQGEAIMALETGWMSTSLQSVVNRIRMESQNDNIKKASDLQIVEMIADGTI